mmetsp:Transcript_15894/g.20170  ORF Transcript_15894/g.20170 Transcript_15894/m.20170 type:complete len:612 (-) Transcript_15894:99-1934(-)|eukprot:CAMPEP_0203633322 /NCGR_PEP_ID=MMETSP0088-20131115/431_1 /ASSEMBLY_ACC=CAM_ASM_001087 /TAXON_ID=426623 /ORGANISM="Chaetoceros affinis, Strain CCMP159" /LENGTH=611 /DNA_ID=CAMNT_0050486597 /DNA_START=49 /DNA_END=1884 /DNA_ORIENTATION=+
MTAERVQISIRATKLPNVAGAFKGTSDPFAVVTLLPNSRESKPTIVGKTEVIKNTLQPDWTKTFFLDYELGTPVSILIKIFDEIRKGDNKEMGSAVFELGTILGAKGNTKAKELKRGGTIYVRAEKAVGKGTLRLKMNGVSLTNTEGFMKKSDPFYQFTRKDVGPRGTEWNVVHRSDKIKNSLNPKWQEENIDLSILCGGNSEMPLRLSVYDYESDGKHVLMGETETTVSELIKAKSTSGLKIKNKGAITGTLAVLVASLSGTEDTLEEKMANLDVSEATPTPSAPEPEPEPSAPPAPTPAVPAFQAPIPFTPPPPAPPTFLNYINGGCEMQLCVAIDFTGSNGDPRKPGTLHYLAPDGRTMNDYEKAISAIGGILADYDTDKKFPVWGFGAKYSGQVYHLFQCGPSAEVEGIKGVLDAYHKTFQSGLVMSSPTVITEVIQTAAAFAKSGQQQANREGKQKYTTLLILTDGAVSDVRATVQSLDTCSDAPLSIIIVGIGTADFSAMQFLDDAARDKPDICQFVEFNRHKHDFNSLTHATLQELPDQLVAYFQRHGINPNPPTQVEEEDIVVGPAEEEIDLTLDFGNGEGDIVVGGGGGSGVFVPPPKYGHY